MLRYSTLPCKGAVKRQRHSVGEPLEGGMFDHWQVLAADQPKTGTYLASRVKKHMPNYTGMLNFEMIDGVIVEAHRRFAER
ncbi:MAG: hypothetical protein WBN23_00340 [Woeseia sp.]